MLIFFENPNQNNFVIECLPSVFSTSKLFFETLIFCTNFQQKSLVFVTCASEGVFLPLSAIPSLFGPFHPLQVKSPSSTALPVPVPRRRGASPGPSPSSSPKCSPIRRIYDEVRHRGQIFCSLKQ